ncbi:MAG: hypothetical protein OEY70_15150, partial [Acidimicrobiia bacterium]|nr:hypothetical protein [Acidimicrobiia bacterium]
MTDTVIEASIEASPEATPEVGPQSTGPVARTLGDFARLNRRTLLKLTAAGSALYALDTARSVVVPSLR